MACMTSRDPLSADMLKAPDVKPLSAEEAHDVKERQKALDELLSQEGLAKYKLEVMFSHKHSTRTITGGTVSWWESGTHLNGDGDSKMYLCDNSVPNSRYVGRGCGKFIPDSANGLQYIVCPHCQMFWKPEFLVGEVYYKLSLEKWADVLHRWYQKLDHRADIYLKHGKMSVRDAQREEEARGLRGELLTKARSLEQRQGTIYPLRNIIKDTQNGADLRDRIYAFLRA